MQTTHSTTTPPEPSALTNFITSAAEPSNPYSASAIQVLHNLQHQHLWTSLQIHKIQFPSSSSSTTQTTTQSPSNGQDPAPQFLISGIPPHHIYIHPDEQDFMLKEKLREDDLKLERMFVLPTVQGQSWSLRRMAAVFDSLPSEEDAAQLSGENADKGGPEQSDENAAKLAKYYEEWKKALSTKAWGGKRLLLAMVDRQMGGDGTVVYYVMQEGAVKPRQN